VKETEISVGASISLEGMDINALEAGLLAVRQQVFQSILIELVKRIEADALAAARTCHGCGRPMVANGTNARRLQTLLGEVMFKRTRLRCTNCGTESYPWTTFWVLLPETSAPWGWGRELCGPPLRSATTRRRASWPSSRVWP